MATTATTAIEMAVKTLAQALVNASPIWGNAYASLYAMCKVRAENGKAIAKLQEAVANAQANVLMARTPEELASLKLTLSKCQERLDVKVEEVNILLEKEEAILDGIHTQADFASLHKAYKVYASKRTPQARKDYLEEVACAIFSLSGLTHADEEWSRDELDVVEAFACFNVKKGNVYKNRSCTSALSVSAFADMTLRCVLDVLIRENVLDTSKYAYTSKKLAKLAKQAEARVEEAKSEEATQA